jgi:hypothetical protein
MKLTEKQINSLLTIKNLTNRIFDNNNVLFTDDIDDSQIGLLKMEGMNLSFEESLEGKIVYAISHKTTIDVLINKVKMEREHIADVLIFTKQLSDKELKLTKQVQDFIVDDNFPKLLKIVMDGQYTNVFLNEKLIIKGFFFDYHSFEQQLEYFGISLISKA